VHYTFGDGTDVGLTAVYRYDINQFSEDRRAGGSDAFEDSHTNRRKELGLTLKKKGVYEAIVDYEYQGKTWLDTNVRVQSKPFVGTDIGAFRFGYSKTPVSFEGVTGTKATSFLELALPAQAIFEGRRTGIDWQFERPAYIVNLGYYWGEDLLGDNDGTTYGGRVAWTPRKADGDVVHLGLSASRERRDGTTDGRGVYHAPSVTVSTPPETGLTPVRLISSGALSGARRVERNGLEGLWIGGPWSVQGEVLRVDVSRYGGNPDFSADGPDTVRTDKNGKKYFALVNRDDHLGVPKNPWGAFELLLRYSELDLNDGPVHGGEEKDWTLGLNWYLGQHWKVQANYIWAKTTKFYGNPLNAEADVDPRIFEMRLQAYF